MTETSAAPDTQAAESPRLPRPATDGAALRAILVKVTGPAAAS